MTATAPFTHKDVIEDRLATLLGSRDIRTGRYMSSPLQDQIEFGLRELGLRLVAGPLTEDQYQDFMSEVVRAFYAAQKTLTDWAIAYSEATWPEGPGE